MKRFLSQLGLFVFLFIFIVGGIFIFEKFFAQAKLKSENSIIVVGHSHPETAINDSLIAGLVNFSSSGEAYNYNLYKTRFLLQENPHIKTVFIEVTNNNIEPGQDLWVAGEEKMRHYLPRRIQFMNWGELIFLYKANPDAVIKTFFPVIQQRFTGLFKGFDYRDDLGGYRHLTSELPATIQVTPSPTDSISQISKLNLEFLKGLVNLCKKRKVEVFFIRSPLHENYPRNNEKTLKSILSSRFGDIEFLDFSHFPLHNQDFADLEHLNQKGAAVFSIWLNQQIEEGLLREKNKEEFVKQKIEELRRDDQPKFSRTISENECF